MCLGESDGSVSVQWFLQVVLYDRDAVFSDAVWPVWSCAVAPVLSVSPDRLWTAAAPLPPAQVIHEINMWFIISFTLLFGLVSHLQQSLLGTAVRTVLPLLQLLCVVDDADFLRTKPDVRTVHLRRIMGALCGRCWSSQCCQNKVLLLTYRANQKNDWPSQYFKMPNIGQTVK